MQSHHSKEVVKDVTSAAQLEAELVLSQAQHGVAVLDVYNAEWGNCKALGETFRRLFTDAGDAVHLRFFSAECNAIIESLHNPEETKVAPPRPRGMTCSPDTQPCNWGPIMESRRHHSKPYFVLYKEGKIRARIEGIDTPKICKLVQELCRPQNPATDYLTNADAIRFWEVYFSLAESDVPVRNFMDALQKDAAQHDVRPLLREDTNALSSIIGVNEEGNITAAAFQAWVGDTGSVAEHTAACIATAAAAAVSHGIRASETVQEVETSTLVSDKEEQRQVEEEEEGNHEGGQLQGEDDQPTEQPEKAVEQHAEEPVETPEGEIPVEDHHENDDEAAERGEPSSVSEAEEPPAGSPSNEQSPDPPAAVPAEDVAEETAEKLSGEEAPHYPTEEPAASDIAATESELQTTPHDDRVDDSEPKSEPPAFVTPDPPTANGSTEDEIMPKDGMQSPEKEEDEHYPMDDTADTGEEGASATGAHQIFINRWVTVTEDEMRVWNLIAALPLHYPRSTTQLLTPSDAIVTERAVRLVPPVAEDFPTLAKYLASVGVPESDVNMMCLAAEQKVGSESLSYGKLALILISSDAEGTTGLLPVPENLSENLSEGTIVESHPSLAFTVLCLCASEAYPDEQFYYVPPADAPQLELEEGAEFTLAALTPLHASTPAAGTGRYFRLVGLPKVIELATTDDCEDTMVLSQWFSKLRVTALSEDEVTLEFVEALCEDAFAEFAEIYTARLIADENCLDKKGSVDTKASAEEDGEEDVEEDVEEELPGSEDAPVEL